MERNEFEEFLQDEHGKQFIGTKDTIVDDYENWLEMLDIDDWLRLGKVYGKQIQNRLSRQ